MSLPEPLKVAPRWRPPSEPSASPEVRLGAIVGLLWRRRVLSACVALALLLPATTFILSLPAVYTARATIMIDPRDRRVVDIRSVVPVLLGDPEAIASEIEVIRSTGLAYRVIDEAQLVARREFNPLLPDGEGAVPGALARLVAFVSQAFAGTGESAATPDARTLVADAFTERLRVRIVGESRVIEIAFTSEDPKLAAFVANRLAQLYIDRQLETQLEAKQHARGWLDERLAGLRAEVAAAEQAVEEFRASSVLQNGRDLQVVNQEISELTSGIVAGRAATEEGAAKLATAEAALSAEGPRAALAALDAPLLQRLRGDEVALRQRASQLETTYGARHPQMLDLKNEIAAIQGQIDAEARSQIAVLRADVRAGQKRAAALEWQLRTLQEERQGLARADVKLRALEREAEAAREVMSRLLVRTKETEQTDDRPSGVIVSTADVPVEKSGPMRLVLLVGTIGLSGLSGFAAAAVAEAARRRGYLSLDEIERDFGVRVPALVPLVPRPAVQQAGGLPQYARIRPRSSYAEALRSIHASLVTDRRLRGTSGVILFTSSMPGEGKTTLVASLGLILGEAGHRVLLVDCDLRRPKLHERLGVANDVGLAAYLTADEQEILRECPHASGVDVVTAGPPLENPAAGVLLSIPKLAALVQAAVPHYDWILLDAPPVLPVPDARLLASLSDGCFMVVGWNATRQKTVQHAMGEMMDAGASILGIVLNRVDIREQRKFDCTESYYMAETSYRAYFRD